LIPKLKLKINVH